MSGMLVTLGETMIRLAPPGQARLEQTDRLGMSAGGSEMNAAVAAARLGLDSMFVTRLPRNPLGFFIANKAREQGVDTSRIVWTDEGRVGTYFVEFGAAPRANRVIYDRKDSAASRIRPEDVDWTEVLAGAGMLHTSGITFALSDSAAETAFAALGAANDVGVKTSIDLNYRARLWSRDRARRVMRKALGLASILVTTEEDAETVLGAKARSHGEIAEALAAEFSLDVVAITERETPSVWRNNWSAVAYCADANRVFQGPRYDIEVVDRVGSGDAFAGGFLYGYMTEDAEAGLRYGTAISALQQTHPGDLAWATRDEVRWVLEGRSLRISR